MSGQLYSVSMDNGHFFSITAERCELLHTTYPYVKTYVMPTNFVLLQFYVTFIFNLPPLGRGLREV